MICERPRKEVQNSGFKDLDPRSCSYSQYVAVNVKNSKQLTEKTENQYTKRLTLIFWAWEPPLMALEPHSHYSLDPFLPPPLSHTVLPPHHIPVLSFFLPSVLLN